MIAEADAKKAFNIAKRAGVAQAVISDVKVHFHLAPYLVALFDISFQSLLDVVQKNLARAERDNDLIYHQNVPAPSGIPAIQEVSMVQSIVPPGLRDPKSVIGDDGIIFGEMLGWGAREAISGLTLSDNVMPRADLSIQIYIMTTREICFKRKSSNQPRISTTKPISQTRVLSIFLT